MMIAVVPGYVSEVADCRQKEPEQRASNHDIH